jgi:hypothetical protein
MQLIFELVACLMQLVAFVRGYIYQLSPLFFRLERKALCYPQSRVQIPLQETLLVRVYIGTTPKKVRYAETTKALKG